MTTKPPLSHHSMVDLAPPISPRSGTEGTPRKLEIDGDRVRNGLEQLVLTLVKLLHELLERQAIRRMDSGSPVLHFNKDSRSASSQSSSS